MIDRSRKEEEERKIVERGNGKNRVEAERRRGRNSSRSIVG